jgi:hypothetical protein
MAGSLRVLLLSRDTARPPHFANISTLITATATKIIIVRQSLFEEVT